MANPITQRQTRVLDHLFSGTGEEEALKKEKVPEGSYRKWWKEKNWLDAFYARIETCRRKAQLVLCNYAVYAAAKLVELAGCDKETVARQACLDILALKGLFEQDGEKGVVDGVQTVKLLGSQSSQAILKILADAERGAKPE
jgi:hypothetical protein